MFWFQIFDFEINLWLLQDSDFCLLGWLFLVFCWFWLSLLLLTCTSHYLIDNFLFWLLPEGFPCPCSNAHPLPAFVSLHRAWGCILKGKEAMCQAAGGHSFCWRSWISAVGLMKDESPLIQYTHGCQAGSWSCQKLNRLSFSTYITGFLTGQLYVCLFIYHGNSKGVGHLYFSFPNGNHFLCFHFPVR